MFNKIVGFVKNIAGRAMVATGFIVGASQAQAADPTTTLDGFGTVAKGYISTGQEIALAAAGLSLGWVAVTIVRKYTKKA